MNKPIKSGWYVLYVRSRHEKKVEKLLKENQIKAYLPLIKTVRKWSDRTKTVELPLFPSYVFVYINSSMDFYKTLSIEGTGACIRFGSDYAIVKENEIKKIKLLTSTEEITNIEKKLDMPKVGEIKTIEQGPLCGLECEIVKTNNENKIVVRIDSIQQNITATIPSYYLSSSLCVN
ncbi:UpxY family transcription antiterminator [Aquimarina sp. TRL1]|uniref:UpxY family transcription antiterminator n=1 Tax=Aquimarina sp. (strain TRL1) TaxID=2736252 RepID=UPI0015886654|nr:UpxY family transcription antiterminator [Aquimarina sp. TRL1]QKX07050.1 UpxY family transcription antiterminator [Aquimarina sp. TRL1]